MKLEAKVAVVTGAGSGIGRAIALRFAAEGASVVVAEIDEARGEQTAAQIRSGGGSAVAVPTDVSRSESVVALFATLDARGMVPDILVNNAGNAGPFTAVHEVDDASWDAIVGVHLGGTFFGIREALRRMLPRGRGVIINLGSVAGLRGFAGAAAYTASKGGIIALTKGVAHEVARAGIRVNCIAPGWTDTPILANLAEEDMQRYTRAIAMGRMGTADEIASVAVFLAGDESSYLTGQVISPNGGSYT